MNFGSMKLKAPTVTQASSILPVEVYQIIQIMIFGSLRISKPECGSDQELELQVGRKRQG